MLAITLDEAKNIGIGLVAVFLAGSVASAWVMKTIVQKVAVAAVLGLMAFAVYSQRTSLLECADKVRAVYALRDEVLDPDVPLDTECTFFGTSISIPDPRGSSTPE